MAKLRDVLERQFGSANVEVAFPVAEGTLAVSQICGSLCWCVDVDSFSELLDHPAVIDVRVDGKKPEKREVDFKKRWMEKKASQEAAG
jgi:hypothetical protein